MTAPLDLAAWCRLTGHTYLGPLSEDGLATTYALVITETALRTDTSSPCRRTEIG